MHRKRGTKLGLAHRNRWCMPRTISFKWILKFNVRSSSMFLLSIPYLKQSYNVSFAPFESNWKVRAAERAAVMFTFAIREKHHTTFLRDHVSQSAHTNAPATSSRMLAPSPKGEIVVVKLAPCARGEVVAVKVKSHKQTNKFNNLKSPVCTPENIRRIRHFSRSSTWCRQCSPRGWRESPRARSRAPWAHGVTLSWDPLIPLWELQMHSNVTVTQTRLILGWEHTVTTMASPLCCPVSVPFIACWLTTMIYLTHPYLVQGRVWPRGTLSWLNANKLCPFRRA